jgi:hypothetical protein
MASYTVNQQAVARARQLIDARQYVLKSSWGDIQPSADDENAFLESHSWEEYAQWHLALTDGTAEQGGRHAQDVEGRAWLGIPRSTPAEAVVVPLRALPRTEEARGSPSPPSHPDDQRQRRSVGRAHRRRPIPAQSPPTDSRSASVKLGLRSAGREPRASRLGGGKFIHEFAPEGVIIDLDRVPG